ncbi:hypothetical protein [Rossellomorea marisflavi]|uniref:hypothetical protein n=1 Tax=Rossellomorea marisflavi TaxID=189381 RepID=UPI003D2F10FE
MNKKKVIRIVSVLSLGTVLLTLWAVFSYKESEKFGGFPVPQLAKKTVSREDFESFTWAGTSEAKEDGLPFLYRSHIKAGGWKKTFTEGTLTTYQKGEHKIDVIAQTGYLSINVSRE